MRSGTQRPATTISATLSSWGRSVHALGVSKDREENKRNRLPACQLTINRLEAYPTLEAPLLFSTWSKMTAKQVLSALREVAREDKAAFLPGFMRAVPGGYGEGDRFLGCVVPDQRNVARQFRDLSHDELVKLFASPWHECRLTGMLILVGQFAEASKPKNPHRNFECREIVEFYLANLDAVNNWDLVDSTAPQILGAWLVENADERSVLNRLVLSEVLWERRIAVLATFPLIKNEEFEEMIEVAERLMDDGHDLLNKAIGWMLREMGKRDQRPLDRFLKKHAKTMPRTMLRYSIERLSREERTKWMGKKLEG